MGMIAFAYEVENPSRQLVGLPNWAKTQSFAVVAKPGPQISSQLEADDNKPVRLMMRKMLAERFHLKLHTETRHERVFDLTAAKGGVKIQKVLRPFPPAKEGHVNMALSDGGGRIIAHQAKIAGLAGALALFLQHPVIDQTRLDGYYDIDVSWTGRDTAENENTGLGAEGLGLLISTVRNRLGFVLTASMGPVEYWVVDHIEPPTEN